MILSKHRSLIVTGVFFLILFGIMTLVYLSVRGWLGGLLFGTLGLGGFSLFLLSAYVTNPGIVQKRLASLIKLGRFVHSRADRKFVEMDIEGSINSFMDNDFGFESPYGVRIEWVNGSDQQTVIEDGEVVLCLKESNRQPENLARAAMEFARNGIIPTCRHILHHNMNKGIDYCVSHSVLNRNGEEGAVTLLWNDYILPNIQDPNGEIDEDKPLTQIYYDLDDTRRGGLFGPVLLTELEKLSSYGRPDEKIREETEDFVKFLETIATKDREEDVNLVFDGDTIKVTVVLAASRWVRDPERYVTSCLQGLANGHTTYLLAIGRNISIAEKAAEEVKDRPGVDEFADIYHTLDNDSYFGGEKEAYRVRFESIKKDS